MAKTIAPRIERAKLYVPHGNEEIAFASPAFGSRHYQDVGKLILENGLKVPTGDYTASLLHSVYCDSSVSDELGFKHVSDLMEITWLWVFNQNLWTPQGVYVVQDLEARGRSESLDLAKLEKLVNAKGVKEMNGVRFSKDGKTRFAPRGTYRLGEHTSDSLAKDGFVIASYDVDGAKKLAEVAGKLQNKPTTHGIDVQEINSPQLRVPVLGGYGGGLHFYGYDWSDCSRCFAFGVL